MKSFKFKINDKDFEVNILKTDNHTAEVEVNGITYQVQMENEIKAPSYSRIAKAESSNPILASVRTDNTTEKKADAPTAPKVTKNINSPLPGTIIDMHVKEGDTVKKGQKLIVLEAMKMENNITAEMDGMVVSVKVRKGDSVMEGDVLLVIGA